MHVVKRVRYRQVCPQTRRGSAKSITYAHVEKRITGNRSLVGARADRKLIRVSTGGVERKTVFKLILSAEPEFQGRGI